MSAIHIDNLSKRYGDTFAVKNVSLDIAEGEMLALLGVNGAGKTTLLKMLSTLALPTSGSASIGGYCLLSDAERIKEIIDVSPQETSVAPNLTVRENLEFIARIYGGDTSSARAKTDRIIEAFSLGECQNTCAKVLSGGWQRRLSIAMALISEPRILFLDEPTLGLDVIARRELWKIISSLKGKITIILTTHYLEEALALCDRIAVMVKGEIRALGSAEQLMAMYNTDNFEDAFIKISEGGKI